MSALPFQGVVTHYFLASHDVNNNLIYVNTLVILRDTSKNSLLTKRDGKTKIKVQNKGQSAW